MRLTQLNLLSSDDEAGKGTSASDSSQRLSATVPAFQFELNFPTDGETFCSMRAEICTL